MRSEAQRDIDSLRAEQARLLAYLGRTNKGAEEEKARLGQIQLQSQASTAEVQKRLQEAERATELREADIRRLQSAQALPLIAEPPSLGQAWWQDRFLRGFPNREP